MPSSWDRSRHCLLVHYGITLIRSINIPTQTSGMLLVRTDLALAEAMNALKLTCV